MGLDMPQASPVALGAWVDHAFGTRDEPVKVDDFTALVGRKPEMILLYEPLDTAPYRPTRVDDIVNRGITPNISLSVASLSTLNAGGYDTNIDAWAAGMATHNRRIILRPLWEMNLIAYEWGVVGPSAHTPTEYISGFQRIVNRFNAQGVTKAEWVFCPYSMNPQPQIRFESVYPGDEYVDWLGLDTYNWGTSSPGFTWITILEMALGSYQQLQQIAPSKPVFINEIGCAEAGGDKAAWINNTFHTDLPRYMPNLRCITWFHQNKETDWRVNSSAGALTAYQSVTASPRYQGTI